MSPSMLAWSVKLVSDHLKSDVGFFVLCYKQTGVVWSSRT